MLPYSDESKFSQHKYYKSIERMQCVNSIKADIIMQQKVFQQQGEHYA
ncbi:hypothetical protein [Clostridium sp. CF012]|nr:hypothetical protein [Clostridium sp. CF012]MBU3145965.1 hypothetical protein [Clostridium sp. CF012]